MKATEEHYQKMVEAWEGVVKTTGPKSSSSSVARSLQLKGGSRTEEIWSVEALESAIQTKKESLNSNAVLGGQQLQRISLESEQTLDTAMKGVSIESIALQALNAAPTRSMADLLPLSVPLRSRKSTRCRADLAEGKPGILLKPKLNPLEGDSSLRTGHGQWWKKDSSAVHVIPRVRVVRHGMKALDENTQQHAFVLKVTNSTLGMVRLRLGLSLYQGEPLWEDQAAKNNCLESLLVETVSNKHVDVFLLTAATTKQTTFRSEMVSLDSNEDSIVDIGKVFAIPEEVSAWDANAVLDASSVPTGGLEENKVEFGGVKILAEKSGSAWFEVSCVTRHRVDQTPRLYSAIPLSLQIEVGNGSWESSLIKPITSDDKADLVTFDVVLTWPNSKSD